MSVTKEAAHPKKGMRGFFGADDGNRTRVFGLGSGHSAIELHLQLLLSYYTPKLPVCQEKTGHFFENALFFVSCSVYEIKIGAAPPIIDPSKVPIMTA